MIHSELLEEKYRSQKKLASECSSVYEYLKRTHDTAKLIAKSYGFTLKYVDMPNKNIEPSQIITSDS